ncbi:Putative sporulation-specific glycosylase ydhD [Legionella busanensis]|uniref:Sporulation-specific glycosylase ydhD n=1 Tax=Legionella busanensis TaxID=190655 RepID=A0A378JK98_9GAMM|nr:glycosyl hydrolase family 18 protein [Legionella busanensis]STX50649.1 Putative sporulation-specific glycosylase ydhD [Legionella busanensis]
MGLKRPIVAGAIYIMSGQAISVNSLNIQAWVYPGQPACNAKNEYTDGRIIQVLKPEYFTVNETGILKRLNVAKAGCNAYSQKNIESIKSYSQQQFVTVSASASSMAVLASSVKKRANAIKKLISFIKKTNFTGIELDFEGFGNWTDDNYQNYKIFVNELGNALWSINAELMIDGPPISNETEQSYYKWHYEDFNSLPVNYIVVMAYDYQYNYGVGTPVAPNAWVTNIINYVKDRIEDINKIVIGIPSYGYHGITGSYKIKLDTFEQSKSYPGFSLAVQDPSSFEYFWQHENTTYFIQTSDSLNQKKALIEAAGIKHISVWHLGGNQWFL